MKADRINAINIKSFRGINNLELVNCGDVNVILGDNNCGKTSLLEAIQLFRTNTIDNIISILKDRKSNGQVPMFSDFINLFNMEKNYLEVLANINGKKNHFSMDYSTNDILFNKEVFKESTNDQINSLLEIFIDRTKIDGKPTKQINGTLTYNDSKENYSFVPLDFIINRFSKNNSDISRSIVYESPHAHFSLSNFKFSEIKSNPDYYSYFIKVLRLFDSRIEDVELLASNYSNTESLEIVEPNIKINNKYLPVSIYGDGIKKVMCIASMIYQAKDGILLIDEIETSLHHNYFTEVLYFMIKICKLYNVQLFITTHSKEIIDVLAGYNSNNEFKTKMNFYTLKNQNNNTKNRLLSDEDVEKYNKLGIEVRN